MAAAAAPKSDILKVKLSLYKNVIGELFTEDSSDVEFLFNKYKKPKTIRAHKQFLSAISGVFKSMFNGNWNEIDKNVNIEDADFEDFNAFIHCLYGEEIEINQDNIEALLYLSHKYNVNALVSSCAAFMIQQLSMRNILVYLDAAITYDLPELQDDCNKLICENTEDILKLPDFLSCSKNALTAILKLEKISCAEVKMFDSCMEWAKQRCFEKKSDDSGENIRKELGDCFSLIRFKEVNNVDFVERCKNYYDGLFSNNQLCEMLVYFHGRNLTENKHYLEPSTLKTNGKIVYRFCEKANAEVTDSAQCSIRFSTSKPLVLTKVGFSNVLLQTTDKLIPRPSKQIIQFFKNGALIFISTTQVDIKSRALCYNFRKKCLISEGTYELRISLEPTIRIGGNFMTEYNIQGLTKDNAELIIHENGNSGINELNFISALLFEKIDETNLSLT